MVNNKALYFYKNKLNSKLVDLYRGGVIDSITYRELTDLVASEDSIEVLANSLDISMYTDAILYMQKISLLVNRCRGELGRGSDNSEYDDSFFSELEDYEDEEDDIESSEDSFFSDDEYTELDDYEDEEDEVDSSEDSFFSDDEYTKLGDYEDEVDIDSSEDSFFSDDEYTELGDYEEDEIESSEDSFFSDDEYTELGDYEEDEIESSEDSFFSDEYGLDESGELEESEDSEDSFFIDTDNLDDYAEGDIDSEDDFFVDDEECSLEDYGEDGEDGFFVDDTDYIGDDSATSNTNSSTVNNIINNTTDTAKLASTTSSYDGKGKLFRDREHGSGQDILDSIELASKVGKRCVRYFGKIMKTD